MTREDVESILEELGWVNTKKEATSNGNDSVYIEWINGQDVEVLLLRN